MSTDQQDPQVGSPRRHTVGIFDIRNIIGALLATYGTVLLLVHLLGDDSATTGAAHGQANLWTGAALLLVGLIFFGWARARPTVVDDDALEHHEKQELGTPGSSTD